jgi:hypothetical protein
MVRQDADCDCFERVSLLNERVGLPQSIDVPHQKIARPVGERYGEEKDTALDLRPTISRHGEAMLSFLRFARASISRVGNGEVAVAHPTEYGTPTGVIRRRHV